MAKIDMQHVPYRGGTGMMLDLIAGRRVDMNFGETTVLLPLAREGKIRALAVTSLQRYADAPELPTIAEAGLPGFDVTVCSVFSHLPKPLRMSPHVFTTR
jgi:tripartite-type tricarboxylate transporter receptor subunit TctC